MSLSKMQSEMEELRERGRKKSKDTSTAAAMATNARLSSGEDVVVFDAMDANLDPLQLCD